MRTMGMLLSVFAVLVPSVFPVLAQSPTPRQRGTQTPTPLAVPTDQPATGVDLTLSPTYLNLITDPGKPVTAQFRIRNNNTFSEYLELRLVKYEADANGSPTIVDVPSDDPFLTWVTYSEERFSITPSETKTLSVTVSPPTSASLGYYYAIVVTRINPISGEGSALISGAPAISMLLNVKSPNAKRELQVVDFTTDKFFYEYLPAKFTVSIKNTGNVHIVPVGDIFLDWGAQKEIAVLPINKGSGNVLPQTTRTFDTSWAEGFAVRVAKVENGRPVLNEKGEVKFETRYDFQKADQFRIGKYTANLILVYDNGERDVPIEATVSFWVIPWKILLFGGAILLFALVGIKNTLVSNIRKLRNLRRK